MNKPMTVSGWVLRYPGVQEAAEALGVDRVTLWRWQQAGDRFPKAWGYKAASLTRKPAKARK